MSRSAQIILDGKKECSFCRKRYNLTDFYKRTESSTGYTSQCRYCKNEKHPPRPILPEVRRKYYLAHRYKLTPEQYDQMREDQNGVCAICQKSTDIIDIRTGLPRRLAIDHNHKTGEIRGLLCHDCNIAIGHFKDNAELLRCAARYLEK